MILADGILGQMMEPLVLHEYKPLPDLPSKQPWRLGDPATKDPILITSLILNVDGMEQRNFDLFKKYEEIEKNETRYEEVDDRRRRHRHRRLRHGRAHRALGDGAGPRRKASRWGCSVPSRCGRSRPSLSRSWLRRWTTSSWWRLSLGQMWEDVRLATGCKTKVHLHGRTAGGLPEQDDIIEQLKKVLASKGDEIVRNF